MAISTIEAHLLPNDVLKTSRINVATRTFLIGEGYGSEECLIGKKPSAAPPYKRPIHPLEVETVLMRLWDEEAEVQQKVVDAFRESLKFEDLKEARKRQFGYVDYENIGVGNATGQTQEIARFDVPLTARISPVDGHDWAEGYGDAPDTDRLAELELPCLDPDCDFHTPWDKSAPRIMGTHIHHQHPGNKKNWKNYLKEFKKRHDIA